MKKFANMLVIAAMALSLNACVAGRFMSKYALSPKVHGVDDIERTRHKADSLMPGSTAWYDSLKALGVMRDTFVVGYNNKRVHAVFAPASRPQESNGTAIVVHGYGDNHLVFLYLARMYRDEFNYNILLPDLQYHGYSEGESIQMGWLDRYDILNWINVAYGLYPTDFMLLHGVSMGAATVMMTSGEPLPDYVKCFVEDCGYSSVKDQFNHNRKQSFRLIPPDVLQSASVVTKSKYGWGFWEASSVKQLEKSTKPMLFIHGDADDFVPFEHLWKNYEAKKKGYKEYYVCPGAVHANSFQKDPDTYKARVLGFIQTVKKLIEDGTYPDGPAQ